MTVIRYVDCSVICGYRNEVDQNKAFAEGKSQLKYPKGRHNRRPSEAVDVVPYPIDWDDELGFYHFAGFVKGMAAMLGIEVVWGGDWPNFIDGKKDLAHWELK